MAHRLESLAALPTWAVLLTALLMLSLAARVAWLGQPCRSPCSSASDHVLIFDETYYVNAARVIAGIRPPSGAPYANSPLGVDPNSEHPQLAKLVIAGAIELFGDSPVAWRIGSVVLGTLCILGLFMLVRAAGGGPWLALGASALMASDNLLLIHGRIGTLDVYALAAMIWGAVLYLRRRPVLAGTVIGIGACAKLVALYVLLALAILEAARAIASNQIGARPRALLTGTEARPRALLTSAAVRLRAVLTCAAGAAVVFVVLLAVLDRIAPPYDYSAGKRIGNGVLGHLAHMFSYAAQQTSPQGPRGIASYPWEWIGDYKPITYLNINPARPAHGLYHVHPAVHFIGIISPPILLLALPALGLAVRDIARLPPGGVSEVGALGLAWFAGTFAPFELLSIIWSRTSYLYYMVIVMPGVYISVAYLIARVRPRRALLITWIAAVVAAVVVLYPLTPLP